MDRSTADFYEGVTTHPVTADNIKIDNSAKPFLPETPVVSVSRNSPETPKYVIVSKDAGRSIENPVVGKKVIWGGDLPGDIYGDVDEKGSRNETFRLERSSYDKSWRVNGLAEYVPQMLDREDKVSILLRQNGLPTTNTREIHKIDDNSQLPDAKGHYHSLRKWKDFSLSNLRKSLLDKKAEDVEDQVNSANTWLSDREFVIEIRDMQVAERIRGLSYCKTKVDFENMMRPILHWLNIATQTRGSGLITGTEKPEPFSASEEDIKRYFINWLPKQMGTYVGRLHKLGLTHHNLTAQNWSLVGTVYDLDTVSGELLGDPNTPLNSSADLSSALGAIEEMTGINNDSYLASVLSKEDLTEAKAHFLSAYLTERYGENHHRKYKQDSVSIRFYDYGDKKWKNRSIPEETWKKFTEFGVNSIK